MARCGARGLLQKLVLLIATASLLPVRDATLEGDSLFTIMGDWGVTYPKWAAGGDPCAQNWPYVQCRDGAVVELNVTNTGITGALPAAIGDLRSLEVLDISNLYLNYTVPNNSLSGPFPDTLAQCTNLKSFNASNMVWNMNFPSVMAKLPALQEFYMSAAGLSGTIPDDFFNLSNMTYLFLGGNKLQGTLKPFANLKSLVLLSTNMNTFTGTIPDELASLNRLEYLNCHTCNLYGPLPAAFSNFQSLQNLTLHRNSLTGQIPDSWQTGLTTIRNFRADQNYLSGPFPTWMFTKWPKLNFLQLTKNSFYGQAPNVTDLDVKYNVSYSFYILKWDCNYMDGPEPCPTPDSCSNQTNTRIDAKDSNFDFDKNCYSGAGAKDLSEVATDCQPYHSTSIACDDFYQKVNSGGCPNCPLNQVPWSAANGGGTCVCQPESKKSHGVPVGAVVGGVLGVAALSLLLIALILYKRRKNFSDIFNIRRRDEDDEEWEIPPGVERFTLQDLSKVTQNFSDANMIGQGGFGKVFVGTLSDGRMVAIKRATAGGLQGHTEFRNEVSLLSRLHHRHLVKLEGFCDEDDLQILVYEFMKKGNLHAHLLGKITTTPLPWYRRLEIAYGVAQGLEYLHSFANPPVIHRDVKPSNILLDDNMVAKLADFGISKVSPEYDTHVSTRPAGTAGYLDPDYFMRRQLTSASDVYAYGVVLLELVTGQEAIDQTRHEEFNLIEWVRKRFKTAGIVAIVDPLIEHDYSPQAFTEMAELGLQCASFDRNERPSMKVVLSKLELWMMVHPMHAKGEDELKRSTKGAFVPLDIESQAHKTLLDHTSRSNASDVVPNETLMSGQLGPR